MKISVSKKMLSILLSIVMITSIMPLGSITAFSGDTINGNLETVYVESGSGMTSRETIINADWKFNMTTADCSATTYNDSSWSSVQLPHDFSIYQNFTTSGEAESGFLPGGTVWYRKKLTIPATQNGKRFEINFDGAYMHSYVYVNGSYVGENHYGYNSFAFDITDKLTCDGVTENVIAVKVVHNTPSSRWYSGSGIYRNVSLIVTDQVHIAHNGLTITTPNISTGNGRVNVLAKVQNQSTNSANVSVKASIYEKGSTAVVATATSTGTVSSNTTSNITITPTVTSPKLWSIDNPNLYEATVEVSVNNNVVDTYTDTFGFRYFDWSRTNGFSLNGTRVQLQGVCMHHDQGALGSAAYYDAMYRQMAKMKDMGVNAIRATHNPYSKEFYQICDELGLLVIEELFDGWAWAKNGNSNDFSTQWNVNLTSNNTIIGGSSSMTWPEFVTKETCQRDVNRPSVFMWSICNELFEGANGGVSIAETYAQNIINWIKSVDTTRKYTAGDNNIKNGNSYYIAVDRVIANNGGIVGLNYCDSSQYSSIYNNNSTWIFYGAETASTTNSRAMYKGLSSNSSADSNRHITSYDTSAVGWGKTANDSMYTTLTNTFLAGEFRWTGWDYIGEPTPWNGTGTGQAPGGSGNTPNSSYFGIVDTAGFEKDTYYLYRSQWNDKSDDITTHLVTAWDSDNYYVSGGKTPVFIYSNAAKVELYLRKSGSSTDTLMGTATRQNGQTSVGAKYHQYNTISNNSSECTATALNNSSGTSLYARFDVTYNDGTLFTKSYDSNGNLISNDRISGNHTVSTAGNVAKAKITANKAEITADGESLAYFTVDLLDSNNNLVTNAQNQIKFDITGNGEIMGVDNGDEATTQKFQQSSVIDINNRTTAKIYAWGGKALVIVRSTKNAGRFTVTASSPSSEFSSVSASVNTIADENKPLVDGDIDSYTFIRNYTVKVGTSPTFDNSITATVVGSDRDINGTIEWNSVPSSVYSTPGDYIISGTARFAGKSDIPVTCTLHVVDSVTAIRNISTVTMTNRVPNLPDIVKGLLASGEESGDFEVVWEDMSKDDFSVTGSIVEVNGTASVFGENIPVKAFVRVENPNITTTHEITNTAYITSDVQAGVIPALRDNNLTQKAWSNEGNCTESEKAYVQFRWDTAVLFSGFDVTYNINGKAQAPEDIEIQYSTNEVDYTTIGYVGPTEEIVGNTTYKYTLDESVNPTSVRIIFTQQRRTTGDCYVALNEIKAFSNNESVVSANDTALLSSISINDTQIDGFNSEKFSYSSVKVNDGDVVTATSNENAAITILPINNDTVSIITLSEDGKTTKTYKLGKKTVELPEPINIAPSASFEHQYYDSNFASIICDGRVGYDGNSSSYSENGKTGKNNTNSWNSKSTSNLNCYAKFNWTEAKNITSAKVYFWADNGGTKMPNSFKIRYSEDGTNFEEKTYSTFSSESFNQSEANAHYVSEINALPIKTQIFASVCSTFDLSDISDKPIKYIQFVSQQQGTAAVGLTEIEIYGRDVQTSTDTEGDWQIANSNDFTKSSLGTSTTNGNIRYNSVDSWKTLVYGTDASVSSNGLYIDDGFMYSDSLAQEIKKLDNFKIEYQFTTSSKTNFSTFNNTNMYNLNINGLKMPFIMLSSYTGSVVASESNIHSVENSSGNNIYNILGIGYGGGVYNHNSNICNLSSNKPINLSSSNKTYRVTIEYLNSNIKVSLYNVTDNVDATATADNVTVNTNEINRIYLTNAGHNDYLRGITYNYFNLYKYVNNTNPVDPVDPEEPTGVIGTEGNTFNSTEQANNNYVKLNVNSNATTPSYLTTVKDNSTNIDSSFYSNLLYSSTDFAQGKEYNTNNTWVYLTGPRNSVLVYDGENDPGIPILLTVNAKTGSYISAFFISTDTNASNGNATYGISYLNKNWVGNSTRVDTNAANAIKKWITGTDKSYHYLDNNSDAWALTGTGNYFNFGNTMYFRNSSLAGVDSLSNNFYVSYNSTRFGVSFRNSSNDHGNLIYLNNDAGSTCTQYVINYKAYKDLRNTVKTQYANTIGKYGLDGYTKDSVVEYINQIKNVCSFNINSYFPVSTTSDSNVSSNVQNYASDLKSLITAYNTAYNALRRQYYVEFKLGDSTVQKQYFTESGVIPAKPDDVIVSGNADNNYNHMVYSWNDIKPTASSDVTYTAKVINSEPCDNKNGSVTGNSANIVCSVCNSTNTVDLSSYNAAVDSLNNLLANTDKYKAQAIKNFESKLKSISVIKTDNSISAFVSQNELDAITTEIQSLVTQLDTRINIKRFDVTYSYQKNNDVIGDAQGLIIDARYGDWLVDSGYTLDESETVYKWTIEDEAGGIRTRVNTTTNYNVYVNSDMNLICYITDGTEEARAGQHKVIFKNIVGKVAGIEYISDQKTLTVEENNIKDENGNILFTANKPPYYNIVGFKAGGKIYKSGDVITIGNDTTIQSVYEASQSFKIYTTGSVAGNTTINGETGHSGSAGFAYTAIWDEKIELHYVSSGSRDVYWFINGKLSGYGEYLYFRATSDAVITAETSIDLNVPTVFMDYFAYNAEENKVTTVTTFYSASQEIVETGVILSTRFSDIEDIKQNGRKFVANKYTDGGNQAKITVTRTATNPFDMYALPYITVKIDGVNQTYYADTVSHIKY